MGFPADASGLLVSGGSMANLVGLAVARHAQAPFDVRRLGQGASPAADDPLRVARDAQLGAEGGGAAGPRPRRAAPPARGRRVSARPVARSSRPSPRTGARAASRSRGRQRRHGEHGRHRRPARRSRRLRRARGAWLHVDGAFGALAALSPELRDRARAAWSDADSLAFDLHKWGYFPIEVGCVLVRDARAHRAAVHGDAPPTWPGRRRRGRPHASGFADRGLQLTRGFRALKVWMGLKAHGIDKLGRADPAERGPGRATWPSACVQRTASSSCSRPRRSTSSASATAARPPIARAGRARRAQPRAARAACRRAASPCLRSTVLGGRFAFACAITNHRTRREDLDLLVTRSCGWAALRETRPRADDAGATAVRRYDARDALRAEDGPGRDAQGRRDHGRRPTPSRRASPRTRARWR